MGDKTGIEWTDATWNPVRGCSRVSDGCRHCYAETVAKRFSGPGQPYEGLINARGAWNGTVREVPGMLDQPLRWQKPRRIFVNSMSDLFHESLSDEAIDWVFAVMALAPQHTFQVLTKRADRMQAYMADEFRSAMIEGAAQALYAQRHKGEDPSHWLAVHLPLKNVWLGVSVEDQAAADERIPLLLKTPAAVRWISAEPLLGPVDLTDIPGAPGSGHGHHEFSPIITMNVLQRPVQYPPLPQLDWVVVGGESGPGARPMHPEWARTLRDQCAAAGVPFLFKQWGDWAPDDFSFADLRRPLVDGMVSVGKKRAGRELDGQLHDGYPV